jgi:hypothetical protein
MEMILEKYPQAQINDKGEIALRYYQQDRILIQNTPSSKEYVAITEANICLVWVDPKDVDYILSKRGGCCNKQRQLFSFANESDVRRWTNRGGQ